MRGGSLRFQSRSPWAATSQPVVTTVEIITHSTVNLMETISGSGVGLFGSTETVHFTEPRSVNLTAF